MLKSYDYAFYKKAADFISSKLDFVPKVGVILGTGCGSFAKAIQNAIEIPYDSVPNFLETTNPSHEGKFIAGDVAGVKVLCMNGRFHFYEGYSPEELSIPVHVMKLVGIQSLIVTNAAGAVNTDYKPGDIMLIKDHIKLFFGSPMRGFNVPQLGPRFFGVTDMYTKRLRDVAKECAVCSGLTVHEGVYMFFPGPQFETPAEIRAARMLGADVVGMSTVTESLTAAHCSLPLLALSVITNMASGIEEGDEDGSEVLNVAKTIENKLSLYLQDIIRRM